MPQIMQPALQARPGGCFMEGVRHGIGLPPWIIPELQLELGQLDLPPFLDHYTLPPAYQGWLPYLRHPKIFSKKSLYPLAFSPRVINI